MLNTFNFIRYIIYCSRVKIIHFLPRQEVCLRMTFFVKIQVENKQFQKLLYIFLDMISPSVGCLTTDLCKLQFEVMLLRKGQRICRLHCFRQWFADPKGISIIITSINDSRRFLLKQRKSNLFFFLSYLRYYFQIVF